MSSRERRHVDWSEVLEGPAPRPRARSATEFELDFSARIAVAREAQTPNAADRLLCDAVDYAKRALGLERCAIFLLRADEGEMCGTWGTGETGETVDEHHIAYRIGGMDDEVFAKAKQGSPFTVFEDCPHLAHKDGATMLLGRGWVACTAIATERGPLAIFFNDAARSQSPVPLQAQTRLALLCSLMAPALEPLRTSTDTSAIPRELSPLVESVRTLLVRDLSLSGEQLAEALGRSPSSLAREFRKASGMSLVDYRNELRLSAFLERVGGNSGNWLEAALGAGFGSYAQFHRIFRGRFGKSPRLYFGDLETDAASSDKK